jgi:hypothetical protein
MRIPTSLKVSAQVDGWVSESRGAQQSILCRQAFWAAGSTQKCLPVMIKYVKE